MTCRSKLAAASDNTCKQRSLHFYRRPGRFLAGNQWLEVAGSLLKACRDDDELRACRDDAQLVACKDDTQL